MQGSRWIVAAILGFVLGGGAGAQTARPSDVRQVLAPSGQLRVAFSSGALYAAKDPATGELKGVAVDLGKELAHRAGVPFQPVLYPNPAAILADATSAKWDV